MAEKVGGAWLGRGDLDPGIPEEREADLDARGDRRRGRGLTGLLALAISGLVLYLAWCILWERSHPAGAAAPGVQKGAPASGSRRSGSWSGWDRRTPRWRCPPWSASWRTRSR